MVTAATPFLILCTYFSLTLIPPVLSWRFFKRVPKPSENSTVHVDVIQQNTSHTLPASSKRPREEVDINIDPPADPGLRPRITDYNPNDRDRVRRYYLQKGPCQPRDHNFPTREFGKEKELRRFKTSWFDYFPSWLEYSVEKDAAYCLCCYLFMPDGNGKGGGNTFVKKGFRNWRKKEKLSRHVGGLNSAHNQAQKMCTDLLNQNQSIHSVLERQSALADHLYTVRLNASIECVRHILRQGQAFRGDNEAEGSLNQGNFLENLRFLRRNNKEVESVTLNNAPGNLKLTSSDTQKDIIRAAAAETTQLILSELGDELFSVLIDESRDISVKEQMAVVIRFVNKQGRVIERFLGIAHVQSTTAVVLKASIDEMLAKNGLSIARLRGQGYDGASNMRGEFNGLKALILRENKSAHYIHCFAHQLQLALVHVARNHSRVSSVFHILSWVQNMVGVSCKRRDQLREKHATEIANALNNGEILSGRGQNQEMSLARAGDTRWGSHYRSLVRLITMFPSVVDVIEDIVAEPTSDSNGEAPIPLNALQDFDFAIGCHLMRTILGITNDLSVALQKKDQNIVNAVGLVQVAKERLQELRDDGWDQLLEETSLFCEKHGIAIPVMEDIWKPPRKSRRRAAEVTNLHYYRVELFYTAIDMQLQELNNRFPETSTDLLLYMASLNPANSFSAFNRDKLISLAQLYPSDFSSFDIEILKDQLEIYIRDVRRSEAFANLKGIDELAQKMVETKKDAQFNLVYKLIKLALLLPVATATVERVFSIMNIIKTKLRNKIGGQFLNDVLVTYIEKELFDRVTNEQIMEYYQNMATRRGKLSK